MNEGLIHNEIQNVLVLEKSLLGLAEWIKKGNVSKKNTEFRLFSSQLGFYAHNSIIKKRVFTLNDLLNINLKSASCIEDEREMAKARIIEEVKKSAKRNKPIGDKTIFLYPKITAENREIIRYELFIYKENGYDTINVIMREYEKNDYDEFDMISEQEFTI